MCIDLDIDRPVFRVEERVAGAEVTGRRRQSSCSSTYL